MADDLREDVAELLDLARDRSAVGRRILSENITELFISSDARLSERERVMMLDIVRQLLHEMEMAVRRDLAEKLAPLGNVPKELVADLANDAIDVAYPVLVGSSLLRDEELIEIVRHRTQQHQLAIASRRQVSPAVTQALVETGDTDVIEQMLNNHGAEISVQVMEYLVDQSQKIDRLQQPLLRRPDLSPALAHRMYWWVSAALRSYILDNFNVEPDKLDDTLEESARGRIAEAVAGAGSSHALAVVDRLSTLGKLNEGFLVQALQQGEVPLFEAGLARLVAVSLLVARRIVYDPSGESLAVAARAASISKAAFSKILMLTRQASRSGRVQDPRELSRVIGFFERIEPTAAQRAVKYWQREAPYAQAIERVEQSPRAEPRSVA